ncbi:hypothetical protein [Sphingomonas lycopersici]|uniref:Uncharacterized protein n=1 Tax=Sphingomonas lycopersici TaxID=2951807 RepID=A0AA42CPC1_9SPHN|nr:hypothetical protein [Sphingomonas lycopersici]MCW6533597.1 hypothetical protein [Sphingomonas lycopersici]
MPDRPKDSHARSDADLRDREKTPTQSGSAGGEVARDVGSRDEERSAKGTDPEMTRVQKKDKIQPTTRTRADHEGASR